MLARAGDDRIPLDDVLKELNMSRSTLKRKIASGEIPEGTHTRGWKELSWSKYKIGQLIGQKWFRKTRIS